MRCSLSTRGYRACNVSQSLYGSHYNFRFQTQQVNTSRAFGSHNANGFKSPFLSSTSSTSHRYNAENSQNNCSTRNNFNIGIDVASRAISSNNSGVSKQSNYIIMQKKRDSSRWTFFMLLSFWCNHKSSYFFFWLLSCAVNIAWCLSYADVWRDFFALSKFPFFSAYPLDCSCWIAGESSCLVCYVDSQAS